MLDPLQMMAGADNSETGVGQPEIAAAVLNWMPPSRPTGQAAPTHRLSSS
ncbi:hypothetical protein I546_4766 [Mycobacterium kansasii 732]|nr:hypothetical protein I546_4766 [Mycobacterium kansasii 732]